ncbi:MAG: hypothetical protein JW757_04180 [Anaerolineales bacterium]|nr:hypothetical protein [Anaerolineales bacterium]
MSIYHKLSSPQGRRDEEPNKELARQLIQERNIDGIAEIARGLWHEEGAVRADCIAVLEEIGQIEPTLITDYVDDFIKLLESKQNRLVWQAMINLALIAELRPVEMFDALETIKKAVETGSVITIDNGIKVLSRVANANHEYHNEIMPYLLEKLRTCRPKSVPQYAESIQIALTPEIEPEFLEILTSWLPELSPAQQKRVKKLFKSPLRLQADKPTNVSL